MSALSNASDDGHAAPALAHGEAGSAAEFATSGQPSVLQIRENAARADHLNPALFMHDDKLREEALKRADILSKLTETAEKLGLHPFHPIAIAKLKERGVRLPHPKTLRRWKRKHEEDGPLGLTPRYRQRGRRKIENADAKAELDRIINAKLKKGLDLEATEIHADLVLAMNGRSTAGYSLSQIRRVIKSLPKYETALKLHGKGSKKVEPFTHRGCYPNQPFAARFEMDTKHHLSTRVVAGIEVSSRYVVVGAVTIGGVDAEAGLTALRTFLLDTTLAFSTKRMPEQIIADNGGEFKNGRVRMATAALGIKLDLVADPQHKPHIERFNRTLKRMLKRLDLEGKSLEERTRLVKASVDAYNNKRHSSIKCTPAEALVRLLQTIPPSMRFTETDILAVTANTQKSRILDSRGLFNGGEYCSSPALEKLFDDKGSIEIIVRYDEDDPSRIFFVDPETSRYAVAHRIDRGPSYIPEAAPDEDADGDQKLASEAAGLVELAPQAAASTRTSEADDTKAASIDDVSRAPDRVRLPVRQMDWLPS